jgi:hypothetical protein
MVFLGILYIVGVYVAFCMLLLLSHYYIKYEQHSQVNVSQGMLICLLSWLVVVMMSISYRDKFLFLIKKIFERRKK